MHCSVSTENKCSVRHSNGKVLKTKQTLLSVVCTKCSLCVLNVSPWFQLLNFERSVKYGSCSGPPRGILSRGTKFLSSPKRERVNEGRGQQWYL